MKSAGKLFLLGISLFVFAQVFTQISFAQYYGPSMPNYPVSNYPASTSQQSWTPWNWYPQQWQWNAAPWQSWTNSPNPVLLFSNVNWYPWSVNTAPCQTNVSVPVDQGSYQAGSKITIYGRIWSSTIGYLIVNPQASVYFDGNLVGSVQGDWNGYYYITFPVSPFLYSGTHWVTVNASLQGCNPVVDTERVQITGPAINVPYPYQYQTDVSSLWLNVTDCSSGQQIPSWAVLGNGLYAQSSNNGQILFSNIKSGTYNYWAYAGGYATGQSSVSVSSGATSSSSICLNKASSLPSAQPTISVAWKGDAPPWQSSQYSSVITPVTAGTSQTVLILVALAVLACLIAVGIGINRVGKKNLINVPEEM